MYNSGAHSPGPGFAEKIYKRALIVELRKQGLTIEVERRVLIHYEGVEVGSHVLDLLVANQVIVEIKTVESLGKVHYAQLRSYLKSTGLPIGLLVNFASERADYRRVSYP